MDRMLYVAMSGAKQAMLAQQVNTNNLANINTTGFRADLETFRSLPVYGPGYPSRVYAVTERPGTDLLSGSSITTGRSLDVAVNGEVGLPCRPPMAAKPIHGLGTCVSPSTATGNRRGTAGVGQWRAGFHPAFRKSGDRRRRHDFDSAGRPARQRACRGGQDQACQSATGADGKRRRWPDARQGRKAATPDAAVRLASGVLESSNVNAVEAMIRMIELGREFESQIKMMRVAQENDAASAQMMRI